MKSKWKNVNTCSFSNQELHNNIQGLTVYNILNTDPVSVPIFTTMNTGNGFFNMKSSNIYGCFLHLRGWIQRTTLPAIPTARGTTARLLVIRSFQESKPIGFSEIFRSVTSQATDGAWIQSPLYYGVKESYEVLYDEITRLAPIVTLEPAIPQESTNITTDNNQGLMKFNLTIDLKLMPMVYTPLAGSVMTQQLNSLHIMIVSDDPNLHADSAWEMVWDADLYFNN